MSNCSSYRVQIAYIMEALSKKAATEISKLFEDGSVALRLEMLKSKRENEALRRKLQVMEVELRAARGYGGEALESSVNISLELEVYDELREAPCPGKEHRPTTEAVINKRWGINQPGGGGDVLTRDEGVWSLPTKIKCESADVEHDGSERMPIDDGRREEDLDSRPSQVEPEMKRGSKWGCPSYTVSGPGRGPLSGPPSFEEELHSQLSPAGGTGQQERGFRPVLKEELEGERPAQSSSFPGEPTVGLELACVWSEAAGAGPTQVTVSETEVGRCGGNTEHGGDEQAEQHLPPSQGMVPLAAFCGTGRGLRPHLQQQQQKGLSTVDRHTQGLANVAAAELEAAPCSPGENCSSAQNNEHPTSLMVTVSRQRAAGQNEFVCRSCGKS
ncbi:hypothetical protein AGOR_G00194360 [Albula goreensis]|uniref:Uncharacterized protein n=1 Tax=Albula goreensis TaxID=1534307 RepID=A0A8T3CUW7_9TELE|nr:hypothetical protein AGOR_G00194360 [Albula goreensis]